MVLLGIVLIADAVMTAAWEDPFSSLTTRSAQKALSKELAADERAPLPFETLAAIERLVTREQRMAALAKRLRKRTKGGHALGRISIPKAHSRFVFVSGTIAKELKKGPGHYRDTPLPGEHGTIGLAGHRTTYAAPFRRLNRLRRGDPILVTMPYGRFRYRVEGSRVVQPTTVSVLRYVGYERLVLTTCHPLFSSKRRLVVTARLESVRARGIALKGRAGSGRRARRSRAHGKREHARHRAKAAHRKHKRDGRRAAHHRRKHKRR